jgi:glycosyltransferase involved in cell wall biosynthesis
MSQPELILNGSELRHGIAGVNVYLRLLVEALLERPQTLRWSVAVPEPHVGHASFVPREHLLIVPGKSVRGYTLASIVWNARVAAYARRHFPYAVFHSVHHFWSPLAPRKTLITVHDCIEDVEPSVKMKSKRARLHRWLSWRMARRSKAVIAVSEWTKQEAVRLHHLEAAKVKVVHNWVRPECQKPVTPERIVAVRARYGLPEHYIAFVGGYRAHKNVDFLIAAWALARRAGPLPSLVLAGKLPDLTDGGFYCDVRRCIAEAGVEGILTPGSISDEDLPAFYAGADLFVSPSRHEGFGYPVVEAIACGAPVIVSDRSAYPELVPEPHRRFDLTSPDVLASRIQAALAEPKRFCSSLDERFTLAHGKAAYEAVVRAALA